MTQNRFALALGLLAAAITGFLLWRLYPLDVFDDAYIHFRIVRNWVETGFPYYNAGERVAVSSSPLWTISLYSVSWLRGGVILHAGIIDVLACGACVSVAFVLFVRTGAAQSHSAVMALLLLVPLHWTGFMETPLALALFLGAALAMVNGKLWWTALAALAVLTRLELVIGAGLLSVVWLAQRREIIKPTIYGGIVAALGAGWMLTYFHTLLPNTIAAKAAISRIPWQTVLAHIAPPTVAHQGIAAWVTVATLLTIIALSARKLSAATALACAPLAILGLYVFSRVDVAEWYLPIFYGLAFVGAVMLAAHRRILKAAPILLLLPFATEFAGNVSAAFSDPSNMPRFVAEARVVQYLQIGERLRAQSPNARVMASEIGAIGWKFRGQILDAGGLASPAALTFHPMPNDNGFIPPGYIDQTSPDLIVTFPFYAQEALRSEAINQYSCAAQPPPLAVDPFPTTFLGGDLIVCERYRRLTTLSEVAPALPLLNPGASMKHRTSK